MTTANAQLWRATVESLQARNAPIQVQMCLDPDSQDVPPSFRTRLLRCDEEAMWIEPPNAAAMRARFPKGTDLSVLLVEGTQRWECDCTITGSGQYKLNATAQVKALRLSQPRDIRSAQQRDYFRVDLAQGAIEPVMMIPREPVKGAAMTDATGGAPALPRAFSASVANVSGGGMGVAVPSKLMDGLAHVSHFDCILMLPGRDDELEISLRLVHLKLLDDNTCYMGLSFELDEETADQAVEEICRFSTWYQRQQLRRRREKVD